tara:strand:+ start:100 stop:783 length:684 start_codon:yes stop_codon:yes gene_type:complete
MSKHRKVIIVNGFPHKKCNECEETKPIEDFYDGKSKCKPCITTRTLKYYTDDKDKRKKYKKDNHEKISKYNAEYHENNKERQNRQKREWYKKNYYTKVIPYQKKYESKPEVAATITLRRTLLGVLDRIGTKKEKHTHEYLDYTTEEFKLHIESMWKPGMTWENNSQGEGTWQVDHIKEVRTMIEEGITDPNIIHALSNLQPLWHEEHSTKSGEFLHQRKLDRIKKKK